MREVAFELAPLPSDQLKLSGPAPDVMVEVLVITNAFDPKICSVNMLLNLSVHQVSNDGANTKEKCQSHK